ncbi:MAG TPA: hypothetical protein VGQ83_37515 [Polyangia bacterium]|jgi:hypothetical protein
MKFDRVLEELEAAADKAGVKVQYDALSGEGMGQGGLCKVRGQWRVIIDRRASPGERVVLLARALAGFDLEGVFLSPEARELMERHRPQEPPTGGG